MNPNAAPAPESCSVDPWLKEQCSRTYVIILCFADRGAFLEPIVSRLAEMGVGHILLVTNAVSSRTAVIADALCEKHDAVTREDIPDNSGSAGGYARGLRIASVSDPRFHFFWLLDDDNLPESDCLFRLLDAYRMKRKAAAGTEPVMVAARPGQGIHTERLLGGESWKKLAPKPSSFLGFHWKRVPRYLASLLRFGLIHGRRDDSASDTDQPVVQIAHTYYGGMLLPRPILTQAGYPDERFFLYADDTEFSCRIAAHTSIYMVGAAIIQDLDLPWYAGREANRFVKMLAGEAGRVYYIVRNSVWIDYYVRRNSALQYGLHKRLVMMLFRYYVWKGHGSPEQLAIIRQAIADGEGNRLGRNEAWRFENTAKELESR